MTAKTYVSGSTAHPFLEGAIGSKILQLAAPGLLGSLLQSALFVADGWFVGRLGGGSLFLEPSTLNETTVFMLVAGAMATYGLFNALTLKLGPWRR